MKLDRVILDDATFEHFLAAIIRDTVTGLAAANGDETRERPVVRHYILECLRVTISPPEIQDYFSISYPGIVGSVSESEQAQTRLDELFETEMATILKELA